MSIEVSCSCGRSFKARDEHAGRKTKCPGCGSALDIPSPQADSGLADLAEGLEEDRLGVARDASLTDLWTSLRGISSQVEALATESLRRREYKVITQKDKWFSGKFDPERVEGALNAYAQQGWVLKGVATASVPGFGGMREEIVILMER